MQCSSMNRKKRVEQIKYPPYNSFPSVYQVKGSKYQRITHLSNSDSMHPSTVTIYCCNHRQTLRRLTASRSPGGPHYYLSLSLSLSFSLFAGSMCVLHRAKGRSFKTKRPKRDKGKNRTRKNGNPPMEGKPQRKDEHSIQCMYWSLQFSNIPLIDLAIIREPGLDFPKISQSVARCQSRRGRLVPAVPRNKNRIKA